MRSLGLLDRAQARVEAIDLRVGDVIGRRDAGIAVGRREPIPQPTPADRALDHLEPPVVAPGSATVWQPTHRSPDKRHEALTGAGILQAVPSVALRAASSTRMRQRKPISGSTISAALRG